MASGAVGSAASKGPETRILAQIRTCEEAFGVKLRGVVAEDRFVKVELAVWDKDLGTGAHGHTTKIGWRVDGADGGRSCVQAQDFVVDGY